MTARELVLDMLMQAQEQGKLSHKVLSKGLAANPTLSDHDRALAVRIFQGTLERELTLDRILEKQARRPVTKMKPAVRNVLRMGAYQILFMEQVPPSAACNEAVKLIKKKGMSGLSGFVNGVLRGLVRSVENYPDTEKYLQVFSGGMTETEELSFRYSMPGWLVLYWLRRYPRAVVEEMLRAFLEKPPITVHHNASKGSMEELKAALRQEGVVFADCAYADNALHLTDVGNPARLAAFAEGRFTVQDESSILAGRVLPLKKDMVVLDLCSAPGGKAMHAADMLASLGGGKVIARDLSESKVNMVREQAMRIGLSNVECSVWDARRMDNTLREAADIVIADLPCSGLGVIGRKPDIRWKTEYEHIEELASLQKQILFIAVNYVKPGGYLSYSTCTLTKEENEENVAYLKSLGLEPCDISDFLPESLISAKTAQGQLTLIPGQQKMDGFFVSLLQKPRKNG